MKRQDTINLLFTPAEKEQLIERMPDQWQRNSGYSLMIRNGLNERYVMSKETGMVDLHHQALITLRLAMIRMAELLTEIKNNPNDMDLGKALRIRILALEKEFNINEIQ